MRVDKLENMFRGWFVGDFEPTVLRSKDAEVAVKFYVAGEVETEHVHRIATEITVVINGEIRMNGLNYGPGSILTVEPGESARFSAITDAATVVVKTPSVANDKFEV